MRSLHVWQISPTYDSFFFAPLPRPRQRTGTSGTRAVLSPVSSILSISTFPFTPGEARCIDPSSGDSNCEWPPIECTPAEEAASSFCSRSATVLPAWLCSSCHDFGIFGDDFPLGDFVIMVDQTRMGSWLILEKRKPACQPSLSRTMVEKTISIASDQSNSLEGDHQSQAYVPSKTLTAML